MWRRTRPWPRTGSVSTSRARCRRSRRCSRSRAASRRPSWSWQGSSACSPGGAAESSWSPPARRSCSVRSASSSSPSAPGIEPAGPTRGGEYTRPVAGQSRAEIKPAYLICGSDESKIGSALARLRARAETEGGAGALEVFEPAGGAGPDPEALIGALPALSLTAERRYLLADHVQRWGAAQQGRIAEALAELAPDTTVVLCARGKKPAKLAKAVEKVGGEVLSYEAPRERELPAK